MIAPAMPAEGGHGLSMRLGMFLEALANVAEVDLAVLPVAGSAHGPSSLVAQMGVRTAIISCKGRADAHYSLLSRLKDPNMRLDAFMRYGRPSLAALSAAVIGDLHGFAADRKYDLVHVGRAYLAPTAQRWFGSGARLSLDLDEDDCLTLQGIARLDREAGRLDAAAWTRAEAFAHDRLLAEFAPMFNQLWISSSFDRGSVKARHPVLDPIVVPNAVLLGKARRRIDDGKTLLFVGSFGYTPNVDAILWFTRSVWPALRAMVGNNVRLIVVGADPPPPVRALGYKPGISVTGWVSDLTSLYRRASLAILPLRAGGGTRIKLLEAASHGLAVVASQIGAAGVPVRRFLCGWIADGPQQFAAACAYALSDAGERNRRGTRGRAMVQREYERSHVAKQLSCAFAAQLRTRV